MNTSGIFRELGAATRQATRVLDTLSTSATILSNQSTSTLFGVLGGLLGIGAAYGLSIALPISLAAAGVILTALGLVGGVLSSRGRNRQNVEIRLDENRMAADEILRRIKQLPKSTPEHVRNGMWDTYLILSSVDQFQRMVAPMSHSNTNLADGQPLVVHAATHTEPPA
jgi:hypothetical protein